MKGICELTKRKRVRVVGLMSGTSADGIDAAVVDIDSGQVKVRAFETFGYTAAVRGDVLRLCDPRQSRVDEICHINFLLGRLFGEGVIKTCRKHRIALKSVDLIGSHGQTIYHIPEGRRYRGSVVRSTLQIAEPSVIAEMTGITTVADFRPRDIACGGQGAPLVPFADYVLFRHKRLSRALQNIGGISNVTYLPAGGGAEDILAFDCGPGNMVIDQVMSIITNGRSKYDRNGATAKRGRVNESLLRKFLRHPFFGRRPPKTTGRETFGAEFSRKFYDEGISMGLSGADIAATATALTASAIADSYKRFLPSMPDQVILCGGGARNSCLVKMLKEKLGTVELLRTDDFGINSDAKEAVSFAILAWAAVKGMPNNIPSATGAARAAVLGKIFPGAAK